MSLAGRVNTLAVRIAQEFSDLRSYVNNALPGKADLSGGLILDTELPYPIAQRRKDTQLDFNNDCRWNGFYVGAPGSTNTPEGTGGSGDWWQMWVLTHDPAIGNLWFTQYATRMTGSASTDSAMFMRRVQGNGFGPWTKTMLTAAEMDALYKRDKGSTINRDWNDFTVTGEYQVNSWGAGLNYPVNAATQYGTLTVAVSGTSVTQTYFPHQVPDGVAQWTRTKFNVSDWQPWQAVQSRTARGNGTSVRRDNLVIFEQAQTGIAGTLVIQTALDFDLHTVMTYLKIRGYQYNGPQSDIDLDVTFYVYAPGTSYYNFAAVNHGNFQPPRVRLGRRNSDNTAVVLIDGYNNNWEYPRIAVDGILGQQGIDESMLSGWSAGITTDLSLYTVMAEPTVQRTIFNDDSRLTDARTPVAHTHDAGSQLTGTIANGNLPARLGVGGYGDVPSNDWNNVTETGFYSAINATNRPANTGGWGIVYHHQLASNPAYGEQMYREAAQGNVGVRPIYRRIKDNGTWSAWVADVLTTDSRLSDARTPTAHTHDASSQLTGVIAEGNLPARIRATVSTNEVGSADTALGNGWYYVNGSGANKPPGFNDYFVQTIYYNDSYSMQVAYGFNQDGQYMRRRTGSTTWTAWTQVVLGTDSRLSDARTPLAHTHDDRYYTQGQSDARYYTQGVSDNRYYTQSASDARYYTRAQSDAGYAVNSRQISAGTGLTGGGNLQADRTISANFGTSAGTIAQGNDSRLVDVGSNGRVGPLGQAVSDWNNALLDGWYWSPNGTSQGVSNAPSYPFTGSPTWIGEVSNGGISSLVVQRLTRHYGTEADTISFERRLFNGTWTAWYKLMSSQTEIDTYVRNTFINTSSILRGTEGNTNIPATTWTQASLTVANSRGNDITMAGGTATINRTGYYRISISGFFNTAINGRLLLRAVGGSDINGPIYAADEDAGANGGTPVLSSTQTVFLTAGSQVRLWIYVQAICAVDNKVMTIEAVDGQVASTSQTIGLYDTGWITLALQSSWRNYDAANYDPMQIRKIGNTVHLRGFIAGGTTTVGTIVATLPQGFWPVGSTISHIVTTTAAGEAARFNIYGQDGTIRINTTFNATWTTFGYQSWPTDSTSTGVLPADSGWIAWPGGGGTAAYGSGFQAPQYRKVGNEVMCRGLIGFPSAVNAGGTIGQVPIGFRPLANELGVCATGASNATRWDITTSGVLTSSYANMTAGGFFSLAGVGWYTD